LETGGPKASELPNTFVVEIPSTFLFRDRAGKPYSQALPLLRRCPSLIARLRTIKT
jgi:hypothetical protein